MFPTFCGTRCREKKGEPIQELFPTHPTYQNPICINPGPLLCQFFGFFGFLVFKIWDFRDSGEMGSKWDPMGSNGVQQTEKNLAKSETPKNQETLHKSGLGLMKMGFW